MCEQLKRRIALFKSWLKEKESTVIEHKCDISIISDTDQWFSLEISNNLKALVININCPDFAPYYSVSMEIYDFEKDEPLTMTWYDSVETDLVEFKLEFERFFENVMTI